MSAAIDALAKVMKTQGCLMALAAGLFLVVGFLGCEALLAALVMWAWNTSSSIFHGPTITFWQAAAVWVLFTLVVMGLSSIFGRKS